MRNLINALDQDNVVVRRIAKVATLHNQRQGELNKIKETKEQEALEKLKRERGQESRKEI